MKTFTVFYIDVDGFEHIEDFCEESKDMLVNRLSDDKQIKIVFAIEEKCNGMIVLRAYEEYLFRKIPS